MAWFGMRSTPRSPPAGSASKPRATSGAGVGRLAVDAIFSRDYPLVQAIVAMLATLFVLINLAMDLVYTYLDPRIVFVGSKR